MTVVGLVPNVQSKLIDSPFQVQRSGYYIISEGAKRSRVSLSPLPFEEKELLVLINERIESFDLT